MCAKKKNNIDFELNSVNEIIDNHNELNEDIIVEEKQNDITFDSNDDHNSNDVDVQPIDEIEVQQLDEVEVQEIKDTNTNKNIDINSLTKDEYRFYLRTGKLPQKK